MEWRTRYWLKSYLRSSMWLVPLGAYLVSLVAISLLGWIDDGCNGSGRGTQRRRSCRTSCRCSSPQCCLSSSSPSALFWSRSRSRARSSRRASSPPSLLRDNTIRLIAALFVLSFVFDLGLLARTQKVGALRAADASPSLLNLTSIGAFLYLMDYAARLLRPDHHRLAPGRAGTARSSSRSTRPTSRATHTPSPPMPVLGAPAREIPHRANRRSSWQYNSTR